MSYAIALCQAMVLYYAISFWVIAFLSKLFGFDSVSSIAVELANTVFVIWLPLFAAFLMMLAISFFIQKRRWHAHGLISMKNKVAETNASTQEAGSPLETNPGSASDNALTEDVKVTVGAALSHR